METPFYIHASLLGAAPETFTVKEPGSGEGVLIGRARAADVRLFHQTVSSSHARLTRAPGGDWTLHDLGSRNGVLVGGAKVSSLTIAEGVSAELGNFVLRFSSSPTPGAASPPPPPQQTIHTGRVDITRLGERDAIATTRHRISQIAEVGRTLRVIDDDQTRRKTLCDLLTSPALLNAWSAFILRVDRQTRTVTTLAEARHDRAPVAVLDYVSQSMVGAVLNDPSPALGRTHGTTQGELNLSMAPGDTALSAMAARLATEEHTIECVFLTMPSSRANQSTLLELAMISEQFRALTASAALRRHRTEAARRDAELDRARQIQQSLLPKASLTRARGAFVHAKTCTEVGGDYADVIPIDADRTLLVVADVAGKGMHAALVAAQIHSLCRFSFEPGATLTDLARRLNALMASHVDSALFATALLAIHDRANATLELINAGHPPALLAEPDGTIRPIASEPGPPLGILDETPAPTTRTTTPGQSVLLYTDGLSELPTPGPALLGVDGLSALFAAHTTRDRTLDKRAAALIEALTGAMDPASPQHDDETFILIDL